MGRREDLDLVEASFEGDVAAMERLIGAGADVLAFDETEKTALHHAARNGGPEAVALLLSAGADIEARTGTNHETPLHLAAHSPSFARGGLEILLDAGADMEARNINGDTPLHAAAWSGDADATDALLRAGADPNARSDNGGETPLHRASRAGNAGAAVALFRAGADTGAVNGWGMTPADAARESQKGHVCAAIEAERESAILSAETKGSRSAGKARRI